MANIIESCIDGLDRPDGVAEPGMIAKYQGKSRQEMQDKEVTYERPIVNETIDEIDSLPDAFSPCSIV